MPKAGYSTHESAVNFTRFYSLSSQPNNSKTFISCQNEIIPRGFFCSYSTNGIQMKSRDLLQKFCDSFLRVPWVLLVLRFLRAPWRVLENFHCQKECASNADRICRKREKYCEACEYIGAYKLELEFFSLPLCLISYKFKASNFCSPFFKGLSSPDNLSLGSGVKCACDLYREAAL